MRRRRNAWITAFVIVWTLVFHYETLRANYLSPLVLRLRSALAPSDVEGLAGRELPKLPFLYPPAGWIMFFNIDRSYGFAEVYGLRGEQATLIDPHDIFPIRNVGYDNIHRNVLVSILSPHLGPSVCRYLQRRFPQYEQFAIVAAEYPDLIGQPGRIRRQVLYRCQ